MKNESFDQALARMKVESPDWQNEQQPNILPIDATRIGKKLDVEHLQNNRIVRIVSSNDCESHLIQSVDWMKLLSEAPKVSYDGVIW